MSNSSSGNGARTNPSNARGDRTRDRLLDALEAIAADDGIGALSHRAIARRARLEHRRSSTITSARSSACSRRRSRAARHGCRACSSPALSALLARAVDGRVEDIVAALWQPFSALGGALDGGWRNYLCLVARLAGRRSRRRIARPLLRRRDARRAARAAHCASGRGRRRRCARALRFMRILFEQESLARCRKAIRPSAPLDDPGSSASRQPGSRARRTGRQLRCAVARDAG